MSGKKKNKKAADRAVTVKEKELAASARNASPAPAGGERERKGKSRERAVLIVDILTVLALSVYLAAWLFLGVEIFGRGADPDRMLPAAYVLAGAFVVLVPCFLYRIYLKFDRKYRSEQKSNPTEETK